MGGRGRRKEGERQGLRDRQTARHTEADSKGQRHSQKETELDNERARLRFREQKKGRDTERERPRAEAGQTNSTAKSRGRNAWKAERDLRVCRESTQGCPPSCFKEPPSHILTFYNSS